MIDVLDHYLEASARHRACLVACILLVAGCGRFRFDPLGDAAAVGDAGDAGTDAPGGGFCGDGIVNATEQCDTAGASAGCTAACQLADQGAGMPVGACGSPRGLVLVAVPSGHAATATGDTSVATNTTQVSCTAANTKDEEYVVTTTAATTLTVTVTPTTNWTPAVALRDAGLACNLSSTYCCVVSSSAGMPVTSTCSVPAGTTEIVVDTGAANQVGPYTLDVRSP